MAIIIASDFPFISLRIIQACEATSAAMSSQGFVCEEERKLKQLLPAGYRHGCIAGWGSCRSLRQDLFNPVYVQATACVAVLETVQNFFGFGDLSRLKVEDAQG